jgi:hypothetical protein
MPFDVFIIGGGINGCGVDRDPEPRHICWLSRGGEDTPSYAAALCAAAMAMCTSLKQEQASRSWHLLNTIEGPFKIVGGAVRH